MSKPKSAASFSDKKKTYYMRAAVADLCSRFGHLDTTGLVGPEMREEMLKERPVACKEIETLVSNTVNSRVAH